jgi:acylphosphatase
MSVQPIIRHVIVRGRVQGVGYRAFVEDEAANRGIKGWVRNRRDGSVEAVLMGASEQVDEMIDACRKGPRSARVDTIEGTEGAPELLVLRRDGEAFSVLAMD